MYINQIKQLKNIAILKNHNALFMMICGGSIVLTIFMGIWPLQKRINEQNKQISNLKYQISEQRALYPIFRTILESSSTNGTAFNMAEEQMPSNMMDSISISNVLKQKAYISGLRIVSIGPDLESISKTSIYFPFNITLRGGLNNLRTFLLDIGRLPYIEHIEKIVIQSLGREVEYSIKIWVMYEKK